MHNDPDSMAPPAKRGPRPQVVDWVSRTLQARLVTGDYPANTYLPSERQLAEDLNVGRQSVAAAIRNLSKLGLVERHPGRGSYIRPRIEKSISLIHSAFPGNDIIWTEGINILQGVRDQFAVSSFTINELNLLQWANHPPLQATSTSGVLTIEVSDQTLPHFRALLAEGIPCVVANLEQEYPDLPASYLDHRALTRRATELLIGMGHRRIGYIGNEPSQFFYACAHDGYRGAMQDAQLPVDLELVCVLGGTMALAGYMGARKMLQSPHPPTAIVAARDGYAEGICMAAREAGIVIGRDLSVIGYDNLTWPDSNEFLTTFEQPCAKLGEAAAAMLLEWILTGKRPANRLIDSPIIMRRSVGPAPHH